MTRSTCIALPMALSLSLVPAALAGSTLVVPGPLDLTIQEAICIADELGATELLIEPGTYFESLRFDLDEFGGPCFDGGTLTLTGSPGDPGQTVIDAQGLDSVIHILGSTADIVINGFTLTGGNATTAPPEDRGGGVYVNNSTSVTFMNTVFLGNTALAGGGLYSNGGNVTLVDCRFQGNDASNGGGIYANQSAFSVTRCTFDQNDATVDQGGAMRIQGGSATIIDSTFSDNTSVNWGGALTIRIATAGVTITRSTFTDNLSSDGGNNGRGGAIFSGDSSVTVVDNSIFIDNTARKFGGALYGGFPMAVLNCTFTGSSSASGNNSVLAGNIATTMTNCISWGNAGTSQINSLALVRYSTVQGGFAGAGNIDLDPMFVNAFGRDLRLQSVSPSIDAGDTTALQGQYPVDLDGELRAVNDPAVADSGNSFLNLAVDMGAYEQQPVLVVNCPSDLDGDNVVGITDFLQLLSAWGPCP